MPRRLNVLMVEESAADAEVVAVELRRAGYDVAMERVQRAAEMEAALDRQQVDRQHWDLVLATDGLPGFSALHALELLRERVRDLPCVVICDPVGSTRLIDAMRAGARDYVLKGDMPRLMIAIERELRDQAVRQEQRRAEAQVRQAEKMDAIAQLASGVAHDFNNLLTAILAYSESVFYQLPPQSSLRAEITEIRNAGERASALTRQLLAFGRRKTANARVANLNVIAAGLEQTLHHTMGEHVEVRLQLASDLGPVRIDVAQFEQAILNLAANSRDAMPAGGTLTLRTANFDVHDSSPRLQGAALAPGAYVSLTVSDTGCGMDANTQTRAFEPFFTTKEAGQGPGLGLSMVYGIVRHSGGSIEIDSELGRGTTMRMFVPRTQAETQTERQTETQTERQTAMQAETQTHAESLAQKESQTPAHAHPQATAASVTESTTPKPIANETVLLVEDEELVREMAVLTLERRGYRVLVARDGTDAVDRANAHAGSIDLLVADLVMPRLGGRELARALRQKRPRLRVLYMSGYGDQAVAHDEAAGDPHAAFLQKPFIATALADKVRETLGPSTPRPDAQAAGRRRTEH